MPNKIIQSYFYQSCKLFELSRARSEVARMRHGIPHSYFGTSLEILESNRVPHAPSRNLGECHLKMKLGTALTGQEKR